MEIFSGIDLVEIARFQNLDPAIRRRFFTRVFTANELEYINDIDQRAAGIFAVKEACAKALGCGIGSVRWVDIEITHTAENQPHILLHAGALDRSNEKRILTWSVSITHTRETAAAVVVAAAS